MPEIANSPPTHDNRLISHPVSEAMTDSALREAATVRIRAAGDLPGAIAGDMRDTRALWHFSQGIAGAPAFRGDTCIGAMRVDGRPG